MFRNAKARTINVFLLLVTHPAAAAAATLLVVGPDFGNLAWQHAARAIRCGAGAPQLLHAEACAVSDAVSTALARTSEYGRERLLASLLLLALVHGRREDCEAWTLRDITEPARRWPKDLVNTQPAPPRA